MCETRMLIDGRRVDVDLSQSITVRSPVTGLKLGSISDASPEQVSLAVAAAERAFESWRRVSGSERGNLMNRLAALIERDAEEFATLESTDNGKLARETRAQALFAARNYRYFAGLADKLEGRSIPLDSWDTLDYTRREPAGVAALITAWNSPMQLLANKLAPALAAGCTVVIKPSEVAPLSTLAFGGLFEEAGFPPGVLNIITGGAAAGASLTGDSRLGTISFTGSVATGQAIARAAAETLVPLTLELGGKGANIIFNDADIERAIPGTVAGIFAAGGQTCVAGSRLLVQSGIAASVEERLAFEASKVRLGDPLSAETDMGPVASEEQRERILSAIADARPSATLLAGGGTPKPSRLPPHLARGSFVEPTVFSEVDPASDLAQQEIFGPVLAITRFETESDALRIANSTDFGLAAGLWTSDVSRAHRVARDLTAGTVWVNTYRYSAAQAPFGGFKRSGYGRERGLEAVDAYLRTKNVLVDLSGDVRDPFAIKS